MADLIHFRPLGSRDAAAICRLQKRLFAPQYREDVAEIRKILQNTEEHLVCNLSFGMYDDTRLVAYMFVYIESESIFHGRMEEVVYIKECGVLPGYERYLVRIFSVLFNLWGNYASGLPVEAHAARSSLEQWRKLQRVFRHYGMMLKTREESSANSSLDYHLMRFDIEQEVALGNLSEQPLPEAAWTHDSGLSVTRLSSPRQWMSLSRQWDDLLAKTDDTNTLQSYRFLWQWWKSFGTWNELFILVVRRDEVVIGLAPMMIEYFPIYGKVVRKLMFIGADMEMNRPKILHCAEPESVVSAVLAYLRQHRKGWDCADLDEQLPGTQFDAIVRHFASSQFNVATSETLCPYIDLRGDWEQFLAARSRRMRSNVRRARRNLEQQGNLRIGVVSSWPDLEQAMRRHCEIESRSWKYANGLHIDRDREHDLFYTGLAETFAQDSRFELRFLELDGSPIASTFGIVDRDSFQSLIIAHDQSYDHLSPGTVLESYELEQLLTAGKFRRYEFLGSFLTNKLRWTDNVLRTRNIHIYSRTVRLRMFFFVHFILKRKVKALLKSVGLFEFADRVLKSVSGNRRRSGTAAKTVRSDTSVEVVDSPESGS